MGDDNTIIGPAPENMGSRNTIILATDANGNVIINTGGTAIGYNASADETSIAIGSGANAGRQVSASSLLVQLSDLYAASQNSEAAAQARELSGELQGDSVDRGRTQQLWEAVKAAATTNEAVGLVTRIAPLITSVLHHH